MKRLQYLAAAWLMPAALFAAAVDIQVDASKELQALPDELFSHNINVYEATATGADQAFNQAVIAAGGPLMRFPGGGYAEFTDWENYASCKQNWLPIDMAKGIAFAKATHTRLQIIVNASGVWCDTKHDLAAAVKKAKDWVHYMNVDPKAYPTTYWEFGNENFSMKGTEYGKRFIEFYKAMKAEDPTIKIGAQIQFDKKDWSTDILQVLKAGGVTPDFFIVHSYPIWFPVPGRKPEDAPSWDKKLYSSNPYEDIRLLDMAAKAPWEEVGQLDQLVSDNLGPSFVGKIPYWMTEYRSVLEYKFDEFVDALFCSQYLLELGRLGFGGANIWDIKNGFSTQTGCDFGLLRSGVNGSIDDDNPKNSPRPTYYIFPFLTRVFGRQLVQCQAPAYAEMDSPGNKVRSWASKDKQGNLTLFLVNNDPDKAATAQVSLAGYQPGTRGAVWTLEAAGKTLEGKEEPLLQRRDITINGKLRPDPSELPKALPLAVGQRFAVELPKASMVLVKVPGKPAPSVKVTEPRPALKPPSPPKPKVELPKVDIPQPPDKGGIEGLLVQDFAIEDAGIGGVWKDDNGTRIDLDYLPAGKKDKAEDRMAVVNYDLASGGWCGFWYRAGDDPSWAGVDFSKAKALLAAVYSTKPLQFGISLEDSAKLKFDALSPQTTGGKWETLKLPLDGLPAGFAAVKTFNLYMKSQGPAVLAIDRITVVK